MRLSLTAPSRGLNPCFVGVEIEQVQIRPWNKPNCLNPCSNGMRIQLASCIPFEKIGVLILVLMECGYNENTQVVVNFTDVLILVLMECGYNDTRRNLSSLLRMVLILVLMECGYNEETSLSWQKTIRFNPCSNGMRIQFDQWLEKSTKEAF